MKDQKKLKAKMSNYGWTNFPQKKFLKCNFIFEFCYLK